MTVDLCCESTGRYLAEHGSDVACLSDASGAENLAAQRLGTIDKVPLPTAETTGYLLLKRGVTFDRYTHIPLAAVTRRR